MMAALAVAATAWLATADGGVSSAPDAGAAAAGETEAATPFARAVERDPGNASFATDYGFALGRLGRRAEAEAVLRGAIDKEPRRFYAYVNLADLLTSDPARWERRDVLVAFFEKGLDALKEDPKGRFNLLLGLAG